MISRASVDSPAMTKRPVDIGRTSPNRKRLGMMQLMCGLMAVGIWFALAKSVRGEAAQNSFVSIIDYGAVANSGVDSTAAIKAAIAVAKARGQAVRVPIGTFSHLSFALDGVSLSGEGPGSVLLAPSPLDSNIYLRGSGLSIHNLTVNVQSSERDVNNFAIFIDGASHFSVEAVTVNGGNAGGIFNFGGSDGRIVNNRVQNTLADAIHNTNGAHNILVAGNVVRHAEDDMIAVVSYEGQPVSHDILIEDNDVSDQAFGRGIAVVGGQNITIQRNMVARTSCCAGIYIAAEAVHSTNSVRNVLVRDNTLTDNSGPTWQGGIMIFADQGSVSDIRIEHNTIISARHAAITLRGAVGDISIIDNRFTNPADGGITGHAFNLNCAGNTQNNVVVVSATCTAPDKIAVTGATFSIR